MNDLPDEDKKDVESESADELESDAGPADTPDSDVPDSDAPADEAVDEKPESEPKAEEEKVAEEEPEIEPEPDDEVGIAALRKSGARIDVDEDGRVFRVILYERHTDAALTYVLGLPKLKELWLVGTKVSPEGAAEIRQEMPKTKVLY